jgi:TldD protein
MPISRRDLLKVGAGAAALAAVPRPLLAQLGRRPEPVPPIQDPRLKALAMRGVEAATAAGATYADVRLTHTRARSFGRTVDSIADAEWMVVGVRALVDGRWGFASSAVWSPDELARLGREAAHQARTSRGGGAEPVALAPAPAVADGHWTMPVATDPFAVSPFAIVDHLRSLELLVTARAGFTAMSNDCSFRVQEKAFASSEGSYCTQRLHLSGGSFAVRLRRGRIDEALPLDRLTPAGLGWELYTGQPLREHIERLMAEVEEEGGLPWKPVEVGRFDTACDAQSVAHLLDATLGRATELDRAMGQEANAGGTSFLGDPAAMLGAFQVGAPVLTLSADRSQPGGAATTRWDDEGVEPREVALVQGGVLAGYQTTRESAAWLASQVGPAGGEPRSHGCAAAPSALEAPLTHTPNLTLAPGAGSADRDALVRALGNGIEVRALGADMDFQNVTGLATGRVYEVKDGRRVARLNGAGFLFRATDLWKGVAALGGAASVRRFGLGARKGEPAQETVHSVSAPPAVFEQLTLIDVLRKA